MYDPNTVNLHVNQWTWNECEILNLRVGTAGIVIPFFPSMASFTYTER